VSGSYSNTPVPSIQGSILRLLSRFRKATTNWNAPVTTFRARGKWSDCFTSLPRDIEFKRFLIRFVVALLAFNFVAVPIEESALETRFGEAYLQYKRKVPRWLGKTQGRLRPPA
jgi:hypothetical protein